MKYLGKMRNVHEKRRSPQGERGLKFCLALPSGQGPCRSPQGERGLKFLELSRRNWSDQSLSARRAWIEIEALERATDLGLVALRKESVD